MLTKFHLRYTAVVVESRDRRSPSIRYFEATVRAVHQSHPFVNRCTINKMCSKNDILFERHVSGLREDAQSVACCCMSLIN